MKLHLGCGEKFIPGWVHIDVADFPHIDHRSLIDDLSFIASDTAEIIYACHVLEHFSRLDVDDVLAEWCRVLKPGGLIRLAVPDFEKSLQLYKKTENIELVKGLICGGQKNNYDYHYNIFDFKSLERLLEEAGFGHVAKYDWRQTEHANLDDYSQAYYPHLEKENGMLLSLNVEARKIR